MTEYRPQLEGAELDAAAELWRPLWGEGADASAWRATIGEQIARSDGVMRVAALVDGEGIAACLKRYALTLQSPVGTLAGVGIGAVFTPERRRGQGHARRLLERLLAEARDEADLALLFSDIGTSYYERLGFVTLSHLTWSCATAALPEPDATVQRARLSPEAICRRRAASYGPEWLATQHSPTSFGYWAWRNGLAPEAYAVGEGYVFVKEGQDGVLWVDDACGEASRLWPLLRAVAEERGLAKVAGWLRPEHAGGPFVAQARRACVPMAAPLGANVTAESLAAWRVHVSSLDHF